MIPSVGRIVHYRLSESDAKVVNLMRGGHLDPTPSVPSYHGNNHREGDVVPMLMCRVWSEEPAETTAVNGQAFVDGNFSIWVTSRQQGEGAGQWSDPRG